MRPSYRAFLACFNALLERRPGLSGTIEVGFRITIAGGVEGVKLTSATLDDPEFANCIVATFRTLRFPAPDGGDVDVVYPLLFEPDPDAGLPKP